MIINELHIKGFGKWRNVTFDFAPGLNLFTAPNEAGKSTLMQAMFASLYGLKRDYVRVTRYLDEYDKFFPWDQGSYETIVQYNLGGQSYRLHRTLSKEREQARLFLDPELVDITQNYQEDKRKEFNFIERHIGLNRSLFTDITWVQGEQLRAAEYLMPSLAQTDSSDPLVNQLLTTIEQELNQIGIKETGENTLLGKSAKRVKQAHNDLLAAEQAWRSTQHLTLNLAEWQVELEALQKRQKLLNARWSEQEQSGGEWQRRWELSFQLKDAEQLQQWEERAINPQERHLHEQTRKEWEMVEHRHAAQMSDASADAYVLQNHTLQAQTEKLQESFHQGWQLRKEMETKREKMYRLVSSIGSQKEATPSPQKKKTMPVLAAIFALIISAISVYVNQPLLIIAALLLIVGVFLFRRSSNKEQKPLPTQAEWQRKLQQSETELKQLESELQRLLREWNVANWDEFVTMREQHLAKLHRREAEQQAAGLARREEKERIINEWAERLRELLQEEKQNREDDVLGLSTERQVVEEKIVTLREQIARASGEIGQNDTFSWAEAKSNYDEAVVAADQLMLRREALQLARNTLVSALKNWQREISPDINEIASAIMHEISDGIYRDIRLDPSQKFSVRVIEPQYQSVVELGQFSSGTQDQLHFSQRVALLRHVSGKTEPLPLFLDDHFIHYDEQRLTRTLEYVRKLAEQHQVFLFSCQEREQIMLENDLRGDARHRIHRL